MSGLALDLGATRCEDAGPGSGAIHQLTKDTAWRTPPDRLRFGSSSANVVFGKYSGHGRNIGYQPYRGNHAADETAARNPGLSDGVHGIKRLRAELRGDCGALQL